MRIHIRTTPSKKTVPYDHLPKIVGAINKWMGDNKQHDGLSLYSFSHLQKGKANKKGLDFPDGTYWFFSIWDHIVLKDMVQGIKNDPEIAYGLKVTDVILQENPDFTNTKRFSLASPIFIKRTIDNKAKHYLYLDEEAGKYLEETLFNKMKLVGLEDKYLSIRFDNDYQNPKTKLITYKGIKNKASLCPVIIHGKPETKLFAWTVGIGNSTGIGFGALV